MTEHCRKIFKSITFKYLFEKEVQKFFSYLLDSRLVSTALKMCSCCILEGKWPWFESLAEVAEERQPAGPCTWPLLKTSGMAERQPLGLEKLGKPHALEATQENPAMFWKGLESDRNFLAVKCRGSGMRSIGRSKERNRLDDKVDETVLQSAALQWVQNKAKQALRKWVFTGSERQYEEPRLYNMIWEDSLCSNVLNPETDCILTPECTVTAAVAY